MSAIDISVIIPTYNVENYIIDALDSIKNQDFVGKVEIIIVDDCSTDNTLDVINSYISSNPNINIKVLYQSQNKKQGAARNRGLKEAQGEYVFFLDGDDLIDSSAFRKLYEKAKRDAYDFVLCDWAYFYTGKEDELIYVNNDLFLFKDCLIGEQCEELLQANSYFTVNKLYKRDFLKKNNIWYGEGYIYEDIEFYVKSAQCANLIGIVQNPLYKVRINEQSTTKTNKNTTLHIDSYIKAVQNTVNCFQPRADYSYYHLYKYLVYRVLYYSTTRAPRGYIRKTLSAVLSILNNKNKGYMVPNYITLFNKLLFRKRLVQNGRINAIILTYMLHKRKYLNSLIKIARLVKLVINPIILINKLKSYIVNTRYYKAFIKKKHEKVLKKIYKAPIDNKLILFLGFDYRYAGNSKYFFDYLREKSNGDFKIYFATNSAEVPEQYRVIPRSLKFYELLATAKVVFLESWTPLDFRKRVNTVWIQLWHGTPFKKLFFDSHEICISSYNRNHKRQKHKDIRRWDYLIADSVAASEKLASAFAFNKEKILSIGYPRVQWLKDNRYNNELKNNIRKKMNISPESKVLLYVPTWRDYNYKKKEPNLKYLLDLSRIERKLNNYVIISKQHSMGNFKTYGERIIVPDDKIEVQELILISTLVVSDFSSIIFDAMAIDIPFYLYVSDYEEYIHSRGIYEDMEIVLRPFFIDNEETLIQKIDNLETDYPKNEYYKAKEMYSNNIKVNSNEVLLAKLREIMSH